VKHPVACIDCHDPQSMQLRVTRPAFMEGIRAVKAQQGVADYDVNRMATRQEMRAYVCGQCHVEYYFKGAEKRLTYPWVKGLKVENMLAYYEEQGFSDWTRGRGSSRCCVEGFPPPDPAQPAGSRDRRSVARVRDTAAVHASARDKLWRRRAARAVECQQRLLGHAPSAEAFRP